jgi:rubrerythrin
LFSQEYARSVKRKPLTKLERKATPERKASSGGGGGIKGDWQTSRWRCRSCGTLCASLAAPSPAAFLSCRRCFTRAA